MRIYFSKISMELEFTINSLPFVFPENFDKKYEIEDFIFSRSGGWTLNITIPEDSEGECNEVFEKSESCVNKILFSTSAIENNNESLIPLGHSLTSCPDSFRKETSLALMFSSAKILIFRDDNSFTGKFPCGQMQCGFDMLYSERRIIIQNILSFGASFKHLKNLPNHYSCVPESWLSMTDAWICNDVFADVHNNIYSCQIYKYGDVLLVISKNIYTAPFFFNFEYLPFLDTFCNLTDQSIISLSFSNCIIDNNPCLAFIKTLEEFPEILLVVEG